MFGLGAPLRDLHRHRSLLWCLAGVQFRTRYQNALIGVGWTLATPLALFVIFTTIFKPIFEIKDYGGHYGIWLLAALFPWTFLSASVSETIRSLQANATFIKANTFPREILPLAGVIVQLTNMLLSLVIVLVFSLLTVGPQPGLLLLPLAVLLMTLFTAGLCLLLAGLDAAYKDVRYLVDVGMLGWFFLTPIFYGLDRITDKVTLDGVNLGLIVLLNPVTPMLELFRAAVLPWSELGLEPDQLALTVGYGVVVSLVLFGFGLAQFRRLVDKYVDLL